MPRRCTRAVARGERSAVRGPRGAGKSTLLNRIAGFLRPASGSLQITGETHHATTPAQRPLSMLFQENNLFNHLTIRQNISLGIHTCLKLSLEQQHKV
ncbi:ATP-binding cassette domain-containing protein, partial [Klebsiella quasipneumoniae]|uniref:ATP-binding cassette domain-containing protein n=1 Tax=Klebsiella quasipneumoniae TaxID=1463165 RepID=UPI0021002BFF